MLSLYEKRGNKKTRPTGTSLAKGLYQHHNMERHPNDYRSLVEPLNEITNSNISLRKDETKEYNMYLKEVIEEKMIPAMMEADLLFTGLYKRILHSGSYYENLKITKPNEFDLNIELEIPSNEIEILPARTHGFVQVKVNLFDQNKLRALSQSAAEGTNQSSSFYMHLLEDTLNKWLNQNGILKRTKVLHWMQSVVDCALNRLEIENIEIKLKNRKKRSRRMMPHPPSYKIRDNTEFQIRRSTSGPAITLNVRYKIPGKKTMTFSIDLVPVFVFGKEHWPEPPVRKPVYIPEQATWCVVPKAPSFVNSETDWRMSFYDQERRFMTGLNGMKHTIKLLKLLRDHHTWACLSSYYIKTVFLWEMEVQHPKFWEENVGYLFVHMLKRFVHYLKEVQCIPFYWDERYNLLTAVDPQKIINIGSLIDEMVEDVEQNLTENPCIVNKYF